MFSFTDFQETQITVNNDELDEFGEPNEAWGGKNVDIKANPTKRRCKNSILEPIKNTGKPRIIMNANLCEPKKKSNMLLHNTCSFDSPFQLFVRCYLDSPIYREYVNNNQAQEFMNLLKRFCEWDKMEDMLRAREQLLKNTFEEKVTINRKILQLDCYMSIIDMFIALCNSNSSLYTMTEVKRCPSCSHYNRKVYTSLPISCTDLVLSNISGSLRFKSIKKCKRCAVNMDIPIERTFNPIAIVDLDGMQNPNIAISGIQKYIMLGDQKYQLCGLIESTGSHFVAHASGGDDEWHSYDDLHPTEYKKIHMSTILHPVLLMYCLTDTQIDQPMSNKEIKVSSNTLSENSVINLGKLKQSLNLILIFCLFK